jgi:hypothetical protein
VKKLIALREASTKQELISFVKITVSQADAEIKGHEQSDRPHEYVHQGLRLIEHYESDDRK